MFQVFDGSSGSTASSLLENPKTTRKRSGRRLETPEGANRTFWARALTYHFVVLQEQSRRPLDNAAQMHEFARRFAGLLKERQITLVWFMTWARQGEPQAQGRINAEYEKAHREGGGLLATVGRAWQRFRRDNPNLPLHLEDGSHPNPRGTYLAACVLYATMYGGNVTDFPDKLVLREGDDNERVLIEMPNEVGRLLRAAAAAVLTTTAPAKPR